jgi:ABC-2 type transport system permease protein
VRTILFLLRKEFLQIRRDKAMLRLLLIVPIVQLLVLSSAATFEIRQARVYLVDEDLSTASRGLVDRLNASGRFRIAAASGSLAKANDALMNRDVGLIVHIPANFERDLFRVREAPVQFVFNAEDGAAAGVLRSYATQIVTAYSDELGRHLRPTYAGVRLTDPPPTRGVPRLDLRARGWYNPDANYRHYMVPGILVVLVTVVATTISAMNIVREKEIGTLEQLNVTPVTKSQFIASKLLPFWIIALVDLALGLTVAWLVFRIPMEGSLLVVFAAALVYLFAALGIGLLISTLVDTQQQAMFLSFAVTMIYLLMSGLFTPVESMPVWAQWVAEASPVKHFIVIMRSVLVKGADFSAIQVPLYVLAAYGAAVFTLAVRQYSKTTA